MSEQLSFDETVCAEEALDAAVAAAEELPADPWLRNHPGPNFVPGTLRALEHLYVFNHGSAKCAECPLELRRETTECLSARPEKWNGLMVLGEGPGTNEARLKVPFVGESGKLLEALFNQSGIERSFTYIGNATLCLPPPSEKDEKQESVSGAVPKCRPRLLAEIEHYQPRVILALGQAALDSLTGELRIVTKRVPYDCPTCKNARTWKVWMCTKCKTALPQVPVEVHEGLKPQPPAEGTPCCDSKWQLRKAVCDDCDGKKTKAHSEERWKGEYKISEVAGGIFRASTLPIASLLDDPEHTYVIPSYHPSFLLRQPKTKGQKKVGGQFLASAALAHFRKARRLLESDPVFEFQWFSPVDPEEMEAYWAPSEKAYAVDTETDAKDPLEVTDIRCIGIGYEDDPCVMVVNTMGLPSDHPRVVAVRRFLADPTKKKIFQNGLYDLPVISRVWRTKVAGYDEDTLVAHNSVAPDEPHTLSHIAFLYTDTPPWKPPKYTKKGGVAFDTAEELLEYCGRDVRCTAVSMQQLRVELLKEVDDGVRRGRLDQVHKLDVSKFHLAIEMQDHGMPVDRRRMLEIGLEAQYEKEQALKQLREFVGRIPDHLVAKSGGADRDAFALNPNAPAQMAWALFHPEGPCKLTPGVFTPTGTPSTEKNALLDFADHPFVDAFFRFKQNQKIKSTWIDGMPIGPDGRMHASWKPLGARTGRWSSSPNCFDGSTEVLTPEGWRRFDALDPADPTLRLAQYEADGAVCWVRPTQFIRKAYTGSMLRLTSGHSRRAAVDLLLTPEHRCLFRHRKTGELRVFAAKTAPTQSYEWQTVHGGTLMSGTQAWSEAWVALLCATQADGHYTAGHQIVFNFAKKRKARRLRWALNEVGAEFAETTRTASTFEYVGEKRLGKPQQRFTVSGPVAARLREVLPEKRWNWSLVFGMTQESRQQLAEEVFFWDGCATRQNHYASSDRRNAEVIQAVVALCGRRAALRPYENGNPNSQTSWQVDQSRPTLGAGSLIRREEVAKDQTVYCVSVPSTFILVRRNDCITVAGQCQNWPKWIRAMIMVGEDSGRRLLGADFDQLELRILAALSGDEEMIRRCRDADENRKLEPEWDPHSYVSSLTFRSAFTDLLLKDPYHDKDNKRCACQTCTRKQYRDITKRTVYGLNYGAGAAKIREAIYDGGYDGPAVTLEMIERVVDSYFGAFPRVPVWRDRVYAEACETAHVRDAFLNRIRVFPLRQVDATVAYNFPIQASAAAIVDYSTMQLHEQLAAVDPTAFIFAQVHDAVYVEASTEKAEEVKALMNRVLPCEIRVAEGAPWMPLTAAAQIALDWKEAA